MRQAPPDAQAGLPVSLPVASRHLALPRDAGLPSARRSDGEVLYLLRREETSQALRELAAAAEACRQAGSTAARGRRKR